MPRTRSETRDADRNRRRSPRRRQRSHSSTIRPDRNRDVRDTVLENCRDMLKNIRTELDKMCSEHQRSVSNHRVEGTSGLPTASNNRQSYFGSEFDSLLDTHSPGRNHDILLDPNRRNVFIDNWMKCLESKDRYQDARVTKETIEQVMSKSSTCQLQRLELSLQCPFSQAKINIPIKSRFCQHLGCFDARAFLSVMVKKPLHSWKCPLCSANASINTLICDGFLHEILKQTPDDARIIEFTSSTKWSVKKDTGLTNQSLLSIQDDREFIDLTYSPVQKKSVVIDLTQSP